jgi:tetratricopeptide (TPR) repeat protein
MPEVETWTGAEARLLRMVALRLSLRDFADHLGIPSRTISKWEQGGAARVPRPHMQAMLDTVLEHADPAARVRFESALEERQSADTHPGPPHAGSGLDRAAGVEPDDLSRRELLRLMTMAGTLIAMAGFENDLDWERIEHAADGTRRVDPETVEEYAALNGHLWRVFALAKTKRHTYPLVREHLGVLVAALHRSHSEVVHRELCGLVADLFQLAGEILFDGNRYTDAAHCYALAASASKEAGAYDLWATALTRHAFIGVYEQQFTSARPMLDLAAGVAKRGDQALSTRYWVSTVQAQVHAGLGDLAACQRALDHADQVHHLTGRIHTAGWLRFDGSRLPEERGACYVTLQRADLAEHALDTALRMDISDRRRGGVLTDLATLGLQQGDIDQLIVHADAAVEVAQNTGSGWVERKLTGLHKQLAPLMRDPRVNQLSNKLTSITTSP